MLMSSLVVHSIAAVVAAIALNKHRWNAYITLSIFGWWVHGWLILIDWVGVVDLIDSVGAWLSDSVGAWLI